MRDREWCSCVCGLTALPVNPAKDRLGWAAPIARRSRRATPPLLRSWNGSNQAPPQKRHRCQRFRPISSRFHGAEAGDTET